MKISQNRFLINIFSYYVIKTNHIINWKLVFGSSKLFILILCLKKRFTKLIRIDNCFWFTLAPRIYQYNQSNLSDQTDQDIWNSCDLINDILYL